ncbi:hypothetical protein [Streptomyces cavernae]|uniref:hypothetical protein n=1 Tax=Streptomyces cavernae TaxID=2259034 RepID=UPI000FEC1855|nr:hypothetical protein [Streptomyces cavernae]
MTESHLPPDGHPVEVHLGLLRLRMAPEDYEVLLSMVEPMLQAIEEEGQLPADFGLDGERAERVSEEIRDEAALVIATAVTGRLDNEVIRIEVEGTGPVRIVTDPDTAADPERRREIADYIRERHQRDEELRGIAEVSGLPTDF